MLYILLGQDDFSRNESLEEIKKGIGDHDLLATNTTIIDGRQITLGQLKTVCQAAPFLSERRLVIIKELLERFEPKSRPDRQKKTTLVTNHQDEYKLWAGGISTIPDSTILVLIDDRVGRKNPLLSQLSAQAEVKSFPLLRSTKLCQWIQGRVRGEEGTISPQAVELLAKLVGSNLWIMKNEINKLALFALGRRIEEEDVREVVGYTQEANVFAMVDAVIGFKAGVAGKSLQQLLERGTAPAYLLVMLSRQIRMIIRVKELISQGKPEVEIQNRLGLSSEFAFRKTLEQANRYPLVRVKEIYHKLLETDLSIKTGKYDGELALNILVAELCQRYKT